MMKWYRSIFFCGRILTASVFRFSFDFVGEHLFELRYSAAAGQQLKAYIAPGRSSDAATRMTA